MADRAAFACPADHYINRELLGFELNARMLEDASDQGHGWLQRLKLLAVFSASLDEFFEIRVARLQQQVYAALEPQDHGADGMAPTEQLAAIDRRVHALVAQQYRILRERVFPGLAAVGIERARYEDLTEPERRHVETLFRATIYPVLTPLIVDPGHPFPRVQSKSLNIGLVVERSGRTTTHRNVAVVQVPSDLDRVVVVSARGEGRVRFMLLEDVIARHLHALFGGLRISSHTVFRVTRNADFMIDEDGAVLDNIGESLRQRLHSDPVRLEISADVDGLLCHRLVQAHDLESRDVYRVEGPLDLTFLIALRVAPRRRMSSTTRAR
jgi:polyphosphate kinase